MFEREINRSILLDAFFTNGFFHRTLGGLKPLKQWCWRNLSLVAAQNGSVGCYHIALQLHSHLQRLQGVNTGVRYKSSMDSGGVFECRVGGV